MIDSIKDKRVEKILEKSNKAKLEKQKFGYNIFTLSTCNNHLENFHSDIFASFLDPDGLHEEDSLFLDKFIDYLKNHHGINIKKDDFNKPVIKRETGKNESGRIDILIYDQASKKAIIIENKMNDAPDMDEQLNRYYEWCKKQGLTIKAILYVSLKGNKKAPPVKEEMEKLVRNIAAFSNEDADLLSGWLYPCIDECKSVETKSLLIQYQKLVIYLAYNIMEKETMEEFYSIANEPGFLDKVNQINELISQLPAYRADNFQNAMDNYQPFNKTIRYSDHQVLFEDYYEGKNKYKLDIVFNADGSAWLGFWNPGQENEAGNESLAEKVKQIGYLEHLNPNKEGNTFEKYFQLNEYSTMKEIDSGILQFTKGLMESLNKSMKGD